MAVALVPLLVLFHRKILLFLLVVATSPPELTNSSMDPSSPSSSSPSVAVSGVLSPAVTGTTAGADGATAGGSVVKRLESSVSTATATTAALSDVDAEQDSMSGMPLLPLLRRAFPNATSYTSIGTIVQANAVGYKLSVELGGGCGGDSNGNGNEGSVDVFLKQVRASEYVPVKRDWTDLRRTLLYARTETRFYREMVPLLSSRGFDAAPRVHLAECDLEGWVDESEIATAPADPSVDKDALPGDSDEKGGLLILECISPETHYQDSPLTVQQSEQCLEAVAELHAAAWEDETLLRQAERRLSKASFHLQMRNPKELVGIVDSWQKFCAAFDGHMDEAGLKTPSILNLGQRVEKVAEYVSKQVSPSPTDPYATIIHGDYKSMNSFLPKQGSGEKSLLVDFASCGLGLGVSDLAMHVRHAVLPEHLENGGEEAIVRHYWQHLTELIDNRRRGGGDGNTGGTAAADVYPWEVAWKHYKIAVVDYFRFFLARMWKSATPETMGRKADDKNVNLINRSIPAAMAFLKNVDQYLAEVEEDYNASQQQ